MIYPELRGKLNGLAVRVPLLNASLTDAVFTLDRNVTADEVNDALRPQPMANSPGSSVRGATSCVRRLRERHPVGRRRRTLNDGDR